MKTLSAVVAILENSVPSINEELVILSAKKLAEQNSVPLMVFHPNNPIYTSELIQNYISKLAENIQSYRTFSDVDLKEAIKNNIVVSTIKDEFPNCVIIPSRSGLAESIVSGNITAFKKMSFNSFRDIDCQVLLNESRKMFNFDQIDFTVKINRAEMREQFFRGEIFNIGDTVLHGDELHEILNRGNNYVTLVNIAGITEKVFIDVLSETTEKIEWKEDVTEGELFYKGYTTKNLNKLESESFEYVNSLLEKTDAYLVFDTLTLIDKYCDEGDETLLEKINSKISKLEEATSDDKLKIARVIGSTLNTKNVDTLTNPEEIINTGLSSIKNKSLSQDDWVVVKKMLSLASKHGINWNKKILSSAQMYHISEEKSTSLYSDKLKLKTDNDVLMDVNKTDNAAGGIMNADDVSRIVKALKDKQSNIRTLKHQKIRYRTESDEHIDDCDAPDWDLSDEEIDSIIASIDDWEDVIDAYEDEELVLLNDEDEEIEELKEETQLTEVLSRIERIRSKIRFQKTKAKRTRKIQIALKKRSSSTVINKRARKLAIRKLKMRIVKKPLNTLSIAEKERIERIMSKKKALIDRIAMKMVPKVKKIETDRLSNSRVTK